MMPNAQDIQLSRSQIATRFVLNFTLLLIAMFSIAITALMWLASEQNAHQIIHSEADARHALNTDIEKLTTAMKDYAFWDDAYRYAGRAKVDIDWAYNRDNMGSSMFKNYSLEGVFIITPRMQTTYAVVNGEISSIKADQFIGGDIKKLYESAYSNAEDEKAIHAFFLVNGNPAIVYAALIKPNKLPAGVRLEHLPMLVFVDVLDHVKLAKIGSDFELDNLHTNVFTSRSISPPSIMLESELGNRFLLQWSTSKPGDDLLKIVLPLFSITAIIFAIFVFLLLRRAILIARTIDKSQAALTTSEERFKAVAEAASDWIWETDANGSMLYLSERFEAMVHYPTAYWIGKPFSDLVKYGADEFAQKSAADTNKLTDRKTLSGQYLDGLSRMRYCTISVRPVFTDKTLSGYRGTVSDITGEFEAKARIKHMSLYDALTGLSNRNHLHGHMTELLDQHPLHLSPIYILSLDLDRFKPVNDTLGHSAGDTVLREVAARLNMCVSDQSLVARLGGDEFLIVVQGLTQVQDMEGLCHRICTAIKKPLMLGEHEISLGVSIGVVHVSDNNGTVEDLLRFADIALYEAKSAGRNNWQFYAEEMNQRVQKKRKLETDLRTAIRNKEFFLEFQPRYQISGSELCGAEALIRWNHPMKGRLGPDNFISIAEQTGLIVPLSDWVFESACKAALSWPSQLFVSVNLSPTEFDRDDIVSRIGAVLSKTGIAPHRLELEITESVLLTDARKVLSIMSSLKQLGVRLSMDDFGTGYSSLSYLRTFPFDGIKIDKSFIADLVGCKTSQAIIETIVNLGSALSMTVTAEGVETSDQLAELLNANCDQAQGYYLGRPMAEHLFSSNCIRSQCRLEQS